MLYMYMYTIYAHVYRSIEILSVIHVHVCGDIEKLDVTRPSISLVVH